MSPLLENRMSNFWAGMLFHRQLGRYDVGPQTLMKIRGIKLKIQGKYGEKVRAAFLRLKKLVFRQLLRLCLSAMRATS